MTKKRCDIPCIHESIAIEIVSGKMTMEQAANELYKCNYTPYVDVARTRRLLEPYIAKINERRR